MSGRHRRPSAVGLFVRYQGELSHYRGELVATGAKSWLTIAPIHASLNLGIDGMSIFLVLMTVVVTTAAIASSFDSVKEHPRQFYAWMLVLLGCMIGVFLARDLLLFYAFFEATLIPSFFLIGIWGGPDRRHAAAKFFLYTFSASVFTLARHRLYRCPGRIVRHDHRHRMGQVHRAVQRWALLAGAGPAVGLRGQVGTVPPSTPWLPNAYARSAVVGHRHPRRCDAQAGARTASFAS